MSKIASTCDWPGCVATQAVTLTDKGKMVRNVGWRTAAPFDLCPDHAALFEGSDLERDVEIGRQRWEQWKRWNDLTDIPRLATPG